MTDPVRARIEPTPTPEETAAIVAALQALRQESGATTPSDASREASRGRSRWRLAGLLGHPPLGVGLDEPLWSHSHREDMG